MTCAGGREIARKGFVVAPDEWRRAAHRCSGAVYASLTGRPGMFDTQIAYVAESGHASRRGQADRGDGLATARATAIVTQGEVDGA